MLPEADAFGFLRFCLRNPKPCPVLEVCEPGSPEPVALAPGADLRTDLPGYRVWRDGELAEERADVRELWREDLVAFLIGCSFTFERALLAAGLPVRHLEQGVNVPMYRTSRACAPAGRFSGPLVVSMRPMTPPQALRAAEITARYPDVHGAPVHAGDPAELGIDGPRRARLRRPGRAPRRRDPGLLGLRRDAPGRRGRQPPGADDHPRPGPHVRHRPAGGLRRARAGGRVSRSRRAPRGRQRTRTRARSAARGPSKQPEREEPSAREPTQRGVGAGAAPARRERRGPGAVPSQRGEQPRTSPARPSRSCTACPRVRGSRGTSAAMTTRR